MFKKAAAMLSDMQSESAAKLRKRQLEEAETVSAVLIIQVTSSSEDDESGDQESEDEQDAPKRKPMKKKPAGSKQKPVKKQPSSKEKPNSGKKRGPVKKQISSGLVARRTRSQTAHSETDDKVCSKNERVTSCC